MNWVRCLRRDSRKQLAQLTCSVGPMLKTFSAVSKHLRWVDRVYSRGWILPLRLDDQTWQLLLSSVVVLHTGRKLNNKLILPLYIPQFTLCRGKSTTAVALVLFAQRSISTTMRSIDSRTMVPVLKQVASLLPVCRTTGMFPLPIKVFTFAGQILTLDHRRLAVAKLIEQTLGTFLSIQVMSQGELQVGIAGGMLSIQDRESRGKFSNRHLGLKARIGDFQIGALIQLSQPDLLALVDNYLQEVDRAGPGLATAAMLRMETLRLT